MTRDDRHKPRTKAQKTHFNYLLDRLKQLEWDLHHPIAQAWAVPRGWHEIAARPHRGKTTRITLRVEDDVLRFFKALGHPYQPRMNDVLKAFMEAKLAGILDEEGEIDRYFNQSVSEPRPKLGHCDEMWEENLGHKGPDWT